MKMTESSEDYLETILMEQCRHGKVRSIDVVNAMGFSRPTVSIAMKKLMENGYVTMGDGGSLELTDLGRTVAESVYERHRVIARLLMAIGVDEETAYTDACRMEHDMSEKTFSCVKEYYHKIHE
ncbi:MAG: metal-dependent transcriptional regulator [Oscillibacter sp.]|nr:metal-dependent transcriptional regulator [Oscillibacter sp.]